MFVTYSVLTLFPIGINIRVWTRINPRYEHFRYDLCLTNKAFSEWCRSGNSLSYLKKNVQPSTVLDTSHFHILPVILSIAELWLAMICTEKSSSSRRGRWRRHDGGSSTSRRSPPDLPRRHRAPGGRCGETVSWYYSSVTFQFHMFFIVPLSSVFCVYSLLLIKAPFLVLQTYYSTMKNAEITIIWAVKWYLHKTWCRTRRTG